MAGDVMTRPALLIDTNVWLDMEFGERGGWPTEFLVACRMADARMGIAAHSLNDIFYLIQRRIKLDRQRMGGDDPQLGDCQRQRVDGQQLGDGQRRGRRRDDPESIASAARIAAWAVVEHILEVAEVVGSDYMDALLATKHRSIHDDYEDDLVIAAAMRMNADLLVTSNQALIKHAPIAALTPQDSIHWLEGK